MIQQRAERNQTLQVSEEELQYYSLKLLHIASGASVQDIIDHTINQDIFEVLDKLPQKFVDLLIIDPPYNLTKDYDGIKFNQMRNDKYFDYVDSWLSKLIKILKDDASIYVCCDWKSSNVIYEVLGKYLTIINRITWQREKGRGAKSNWKNAMEDIWFAVKNEKDYYFDVESVKQKREVLAPYKEDGRPKDWKSSEEGNYRLTYPSNFWDDISIPFWSMPENTDHPTQKPEKLIAKLILASCPKNGVVFDPFLGSGTTSVVAKKLNRHFCGVEINTKYACLAEKRLRIADVEQNIQGYSGGVFWERNSFREQKRIKSGQEKSQ